MKRLASLVHYSSSEEDESEEIQPASKKKKLPTLSTFFKGNVHVDDPSKHQGRIRTMPHVDGQFAAHVYIPLTVPTTSPLYSVIIRSIDHIRERVPSIHSIWDDSAEPDTKKRHELHLSLSYPIYLRAHQRGQLTSAVKAMAAVHRIFTVSFAEFGEFTNDERTRAFLALEVGAGHIELNALVQALRPTVKAIQQQLYYDAPRFHASFAWTLLDMPSNPHSNGYKTSLPDDSMEPSSIPNLPLNLVPELKERFSHDLTASGVAVFTVNSLAVKIGKDVFNCPLIE